MHNDSSSPSAFCLLPSAFADWRVFAAAAGATLAASSAADAAIIYVDPTVKPTATLGTSGKHFSIDGLNINLFVTNASIATVAGAEQNVRRLFIDQGGATGVGYAVKFKLGSTITGVPATGAEFRARVQSAPFNKYGAFTTGNTGLAGFKLPASKGGGFGWMRVEVSSMNGDGRPDEVTAIDWAYNDAGGGITAGQTMASPVPEPSTKAIALLALGSAGVLAWRKRRNAAAN